MKKFIILISIFVCSLFVGATYAQNDNMLLAPTKASCMFQGDKYQLANQWLSMDTTCVDGDSLQFTIYSGKETYHFSYPITSVVQGGNKCIYRCNPYKNKEMACLIIYAETYHDNVYQENGEPPICCEWSKRYAVLRTRTSYGYTEYKFRWS